MADLSGRTLGKYRLLERLGRGGMAEVYKAYQPNLEREVAIKVMHAYLAEDGDFIGRFKREAKAVAALHHPHIIQIYDFDVEDDIYYMVMEYIGGETLKARLERLHAEGKRMTLEEVDRIFHDLCAALDYAHAQGRIHRDIKPANIMFDGDRLILADFGIASIVGGTSYTAPGMMVGTPAYMSPEQCRGEPGDSRSDVYALGIVLYEALTGRLPFDADTPLAIVMKHLHDPLPLPRQAIPDLPPAVEKLILKALAKAPEDRFQKAGELAQALSAALVAASAPAGAAVQPVARPEPGAVAAPPATPPPAAPPALAQQLLGAIGKSEQVAGALEQAKEVMRATRDVARDVTPAIGKAVQDALAQAADGIRARAPGVAATPPPSPAGPGAAATPPPAPAAPTPPPAPAASLGPAAMAAPAPAASLEPTAMAAPATPASAVASAPRRRFPWVYGAAGLLVVALVVTLAFVFRGGRLLGRPPMGVIAPGRPTVAAPPSPQQAVDPKAMAPFSTGMEAYGAGDYPRAIQSYGEAIQVDPDFALAYQMRGQAYADSGNYGAAEADLTKAIQFDPQAPEAYFARGRLYLEAMERPRDALPDFTRAIELKPDYKEAYYYRAVILRDQDINLALADLDKAISLDRNYADPLRARGDIYFYDEKYEPAQKDLARAVELDPYDDYSRFTLGAILGLRGQYDDMEKVFSAGIQLHPENLDFYYGRGLAYVALKKERLARADLEKVLAANPGQSGAHYGLGLLAVQAGRYEEAVNEFSLTIADPDAVYVWPFFPHDSPYLDRAMAYVQLNNTKAAMDDLNLLIEQRGDWYLPYYRRGQLNKQLGQMEAAAADFRMALDLAPNPEWKSTIQKELDDLPRP